MPTEKFSGNTIRKAQKDAAHGTKKEIVYRDELGPGLAIRIQGSRADWYYKTRDHKIHIAPLAVFSLEDIPYLRRLTSQAKDIARRGEDPKPLLKEAIHQADVAEAEAAAGVREKKIWLWEDLRDRFINHMLDNGRPKTASTYKSALGASGGIIAKDFAFVVGKPLTLITAEDIRAVRNSIRERGTSEGRHKGNISQANSTLRTVKSAFAWAVENSKITGLRIDPAIGIKSLKKPKSESGELDDEEARARPLMPEEIRAFWNYAEQYPNRAVGTLVRLQLLTGQRVYSVVTAQVESFLPAEDGAAHDMLWRLGSDKTDSRRQIPLPKRAADLVREARRLADETDPDEYDKNWLFPQLKYGVGAGKDSIKRHMNESTAQTFFKKIRKDGAVLPEDAGSTHSLRKAFISYLQAYWSVLGLASDTSSDLITHASEGRETTSQRIYNIDKNLFEKWRVMKAFDDYIAGCIDGSITSESLRRLAGQQNVLSAQAVQQAVSKPFTQASSVAPTGLG